MNKTILRNMIADYLDISDTGTEEYSLMGAGFNSLNESPSAQKDQKAYINDKTSTTIVKGYQVSFAYDTDLMKSEKPIMKLYTTGRNQLQGEAAEMNYIRVDLFEELIPPVSNEFPARKFRVANVVDSISGAGAEVIKVTGNLNGVGDFIDGSFNTTSKTFTPNVVITP